MGTTLHAVIQRQVGEDRENAWMTVANLDFGKDYELSIAISRTGAGDPYKDGPDGRDVDLTRLLYHLDASGGSDIQVLSEKEIRAFVAANKLPHPKKSLHMEQLFNVLETAGERAWTLRVAFWRI